MPSFVILEPEEFQKDQRKKTFLPKGSVVKLSKAEGARLCKAGIVDLTDEEKELKTKKPKTVHVEKPDFSEVSEYALVEYAELFHSIRDNIAVRVNVVSFFEGITELPQTGEAKKTILLSCIDPEGKSTTPVSAYYFPEGNEQPIGLVEIKGRVGYLSGKKGSIKPKPLVIWVAEISQLEHEFEKENPSVEEQAALNAIAEDLNNSDFQQKVDCSIAPQIYGRGFEKAFALITAAAPVNLVFNGTRKRYLPKLCYFGDPRNSKDTILEDLFFEILPTPAVHVNAESALNTGLTGSCQRDPVTDFWEINWGALPSAHKGACYLSGISGYPDKSWTALRETLSQGVVSIQKAARGTKPCETRFFLSANTTRDLSYYRNAIIGFRDVGSKDKKLFMETADALRISVPLPFSKADVSLKMIDDQIGSIKEQGYSKRLLKLKIAEAWRADGKEMTVESQKLVKDKISHMLAEWRKLFETLDLAVLTAEGFWIVLQNVLGVAILRNHYSADGKLNPTVEDCVIVEQLFDTMFERLGMFRELEALEQLRKEAERIECELGSLDEKKQDYYEFYSKLISDCWKAGVPFTADEYAEKHNMARSTFFSNKSRAESLLVENTLVKHSLFDSRQGKGFALSEFGCLVAKELEKHG